MYKGTINTTGKLVKFVEGEKYKHVPADTVLAANGNMLHLHVRGPWTGSCVSELGCVKA